MSPQRWARAFCLNGLSLFPLYEKVIRTFALSRYLLNLIVKTRYQSIYEHTHNPLTSLLANKNLYFLKRSEHNIFLGVPYRYSPFSTNPLHAALSRYLRPLGLTGHIAYFTFKPFTVFVRLLYVSGPELDNAVVSGPETRHMPLYLVQKLVDICRCTSIWSWN